MALAGPLLAACAASPATRPPPGARDAPSPPGAPAPDASYDWHALEGAPFGRPLKDSGIPMHEVLMFHDADVAGVPGFNDCYSVDGAPPRFLGTLPDEYLLCFEHDRLARIEASVLLPSGEAAQTFARACALWLKVAAPPAGAVLCEGREAAVAFSARLAGRPDESGTRVSMTLTAGVDPGAADDAPRGP